MTSVPISTRSPSMVTTSPSATRSSTPTPDVVDQDGAAAHDLQRTRGSGSAR